jgi:sugar diacid utilization regulator
LDDLAEGLVGLLDRAVVIENPSLKLMAAASTGPVDEVRRRTIEEGGTPRKLISHLTAQGVFERLRRDPRPQRVPPVPDMGMTEERILAPIIVGTHLYGYVWIIATGRPLTQLDFMAIESATVVAALIMSRQQSVHEAEQRLKSALLDNLLDPDPYRDLQDLTRIHRGLGLHQGYQLMIVEPQPQGEPSPGQLYGLVEGLMHATGLKATVVERGARLVVLLATGDQDRGLEVARSVAVDGTRQGVPLAIGLSTASDQVTRVRQCYQEAMEALRVGKALSSGKPGVWTFEELGFLHWLRAVPPDLQRVSRYHQVVSAIVKHDQENRTDLLKTLETYLDAFGNAQQATRQLYIHRNTLRQRLSKIEDLWALRLEDPTTMLNLLIAIKDWRLNRSE